MTVVLLLLSGDPSEIEGKLATRFPHAQIQTMSRSDIEASGLTTGLRRLRALRPDVFVIATERLQWQRGQSAFMLFGALTGAHEVIMLDGHGGEVTRSRANLLSKAPIELASDAISSARVLAKAERQLVQLEERVQSSTFQPLAETTAHPRITYLRSTPGPGTQAGGAASHIKGVVEGLVELGATVDVVSNDRIAGFDENKVDITVIEPVSAGSSRAIFDINNNLNFTGQLRSFLQQTAPDLIYQRYARFSWAGVAAALETRRPLFLEYNGSEVWVGRHWDRVGKLDLLERYERLNLKAATRIFVVSEVERRNLESRGVISEKIIINPNGVDARVFQPGVGGREIRRKLGLADNDVVAGFVGTFGPWHGVLVLAEAIRKIVADFPVRFLLVGTGSLYAQVQQELANETKARRVIFTGPVSHNEVPDLLDACDILLSPHVPLQDGSDFFGSPTKLFEYMAMAKGIVASRLGQIADVLDDGRTALLVEPGDPLALANAIRRLVESEQLRHDLGLRARETAVQKHTWTDNAQRVLDEYRSLA